MTESKLKKEWLILSTDDTMEKKYFYGKVIKISDIEDGQVVLSEGYLDNAVIRESFPELKELLNDGLYTPIRLFINGGKLELLEKKNMIETLENLKFDFSAEGTSYFLYEELAGEQSTFEYLAPNDEVNKNYIEFWKTTTAKPFDSMSRDEVDEVMSKYNLPLSIENKPIGLLLATVFFSLLGFGLLYLLIQEGKQDFMMFGVSLLLLLGAGASLFLYIKPTLVVLTQKGIEIKGIRSFEILWSEIESIDIFANKMITYMPNESSSKKKVYGGYVIPLQQKPLEETLVMLRELHYFYAEYLIEDKISTCQY